VLQAISKGTDVCAAMDANEVLDTTNQLFHKWITKCGLISVHENLHDKEYYKANPMPTTYQHGGKKIDHVFCTPNYLDVLQKLPLSLSMTELSWIIRPSL
jgi:hypothetical protein